MIAQPGIDIHSSSEAIPPSPADADASVDGRAWSGAAPALAAWASRTLIVRDDCYGGYYIDRDGAVAQTTHWAVAGIDRRGRPRRVAPRLDLDRLIRHFEGSDVLAAKVGAHIADADCRCIAGVVDIDAHGPGDDPVANSLMAARIVGRLGAMGLPHRLIDSNGRGGFHVWYLFGRRAPMAWAHRLGKYLVRDHADCGMSSPPESNPKSDRLGPMGCGNFVRLPGRHHKREHWSTVWSPGEGRWLRGRDAVESLLAFAGDPAIDLAGLIPPGFVPAASPSRPLAGPGRGTAPGFGGPDFRDRVAGESGEVARARAALASLGPECCHDYDAWCEVGMSLASLEEDGFDLWDEWSAQVADKYPGRAELEAKWSSFLPGEWPSQVTIGSLLHRANEAGWDGRYAVTPVDCERSRRRSSVLDSARPRAVTSAMSRGWADEFDVQSGALAGRPESLARLAARLALTPSALAVVAASAPFGLKRTNRGKRADGSTGPLGAAWTWCEVDASGRPVGIRRLFCEPGASAPEVGAGDRPARREGGPDRLARFSRRGLLSNLSRPDLRPGEILLVVGLFDFAAIAARRRPCVALPRHARQASAGLDDLAALLADDDRPVVVPFREGEPDPWAAARPVAEALGREIGVGVLAKPYPAEHGSIHGWLSSTPNPCIGGAR